MSVSTPIRIVLSAACSCVAPAATATTTAKPNTVFMAGIPPLVNDCYDFDSLYCRHITLDWDTPRVIDRGGQFSDPQGQPKLARGDDSSALSDLMCTLGHKRTCAPRV